MKEKDIEIDNLLKAENAKNLHRISESLKWTNLMLAAILAQLIMLWIIH